MLTILGWFLPHDVWSWLGYIAAAVIIALLWLVPAQFLRLSERIAGTVVILCAVTLVAQWSAISHAEADTAKWKNTAQAAKAETAAAEQKNRLLEQAAIERAMDDKQVADMQKEITDAINAAPESSPDAAAVALGCIRLRAAGKTTSPEYHSLCA